MNPISIVENIDCVEGMKDFPDKFFDLAICDPPYGSQINGNNIERTGGTWQKKYGGKIKSWDIAPNEEYFTELFRVSKNIIIWGGNYFNLPPSNNFLIWRKLSISETFSMAMAEYAWTNIKGNAKVFEFAPQDKTRFHPTQKPVALYRWILENYAKQGDKILDTHLGSQSSRITSYKKGFDFWGFELDEDYYKQGNERFEKAIAMPLFDGMNKSNNCLQLTI